MVAGKVPTISLSLFTDHQAVKESKGFHTSDVILKLGFYNEDNDGW